MILNYRQIKKKPIKQYPRCSRFGGNHTAFVKKERGTFDLQTTTQTRLTDEAVNTAVNSIER